MTRRHSSSHSETTKPLYWSQAWGFAAHPVEAVPLSAKTFKTGTSPRLTTSAAARRDQHARAHPTRSEMVGAHAFNREGRDLSTSRDRNLAFPRCPVRECGTAFVTQTTSYLDPLRHIEQKPKGKRGNLTRVVHLQGGAVLGPRTAPGGIVAVRARASCRAAAKPLSFALPGLRRLAGRRALTETLRADSYDCQWLKLGSPPVAIRGDLNRATTEGLTWPRTVIAMVIPVPSRSFGRGRRQLASRLSAV
jgi:hypothetical protein